MPIQPKANLTVGDERWHQVYRPSWETLIGIGYAPNSAMHMYALDIHGLTNADGKVSFFGGGSGIAFDMQPWPDGTSGSYYIRSDSASDTDLALIWGIDSSGDMAFYEITLQGTTPLLISPSLQHVNAVRYLGGSTANVGTITVSKKSTAGNPAIVADNVQVIMGAGWGYAVNPTMMAANGEVMVFPEINISADRNDGVEVEIYQGWLDTFDNSVHRQKTTEWYVYSHAFQNHFGVPIVVGPGEWIRLTIERLSGASSVIAACDLRHYGLYDDNTNAGGSALFDQG